MIVIGGKFLEGQKVCVLLAHKLYIRVVHYNPTDGLYITVNGCKRFEYEAEYRYKEE